MASSCLRRLAKSLEVRALKPAEPLVAGKQRCDPVARGQ